MYWVISRQKYLDTDQVSSLSGEHIKKRHLIRARPEGRFYESLVCIVLIIGSERDIMKKCLITCESAYIH